MSQDQERYNLRPRKPTGAPVVAPLTEEERVALEEKQRQAEEEKARKKEREEQKKLENMHALEEFFQKRFHGNVLEEKDYLSDFYDVYKSYKYMWLYPVWKKFLFKCIETDRGDITLFYLSMILEKKHYTIHKIDFMEELLHEMRIKKKYILFWEKPLWEKLQEKHEYRTTSWWRNHIVDSVEDEEYMYRLTQSKWEFINEEFLFTAIPKMSDRTMMHIIGAIYKNPSLELYRFNGNLSQQEILKKLFPSNQEYTPEHKDKFRQFLYQLMVRKIIPPLTIQIVRTNTFDEHEYSTAGLYKFILLLIDLVEKEKLEHPINDSIVYALKECFQLKQIDNDIWFLGILDRLCRPGYFEAVRDNISEKVNVKELKTLVSFLVDVYKININNVYMKINRLYRGTESDQPKLLTYNPRLYLNRNIPVVAWAILNKNVDITYFFVFKLGAKLDRCVITMEDLIPIQENVPLSNKEKQLFKLFTLKDKTTRTVREYIQKKYNPDSEYVRNILLPRLKEQGEALEKKEGGRKKRTSKER